MSSETYYLKIFFYPFFLLVLSYHSLRASRNQVSFWHILLLKTLPCPEGQAVWLLSFFFAFSVMFLRLSVLLSLLESKTSLILRTVSHKSYFLKCLPGSYVVLFSSLSMLFAFFFFLKGSIQSWHWALEVSGADKCLSRLVVQRGKMNYRIYLPGLT